jgi:hypothetical protein
VGDQILGSDIVGVESIVLAVAIVAAALVVAASRRPSATTATPAPTAFKLLAGGEPFADAPLAALVPGQPAIRVFSRRPPQPAMTASRPGAPAHYTLTLARGGYGRWSSVLDGPAPGDGQPGVLTLTLNIPWSDIARSYSAIDLVLK